jgi:hypothetical protein
VSSISSLNLSCRILQKQIGTGQWWKHISDFKSCCSVYFQELNSIKKIKILSKINFLRYIISIFHW